MPTLEHRLQILLDENRYARLARASEQSGQSIGALIRGAIDVSFRDADRHRATAVEMLLASADSDETPGEEWDTAKAAIESDMTGHLA